MNQEKLIKQGIKYTDALFQSIENRLLLGIRSSDTLEAFLEATKDLTVENPLVTTGYTDAMSKIILLETNNHKFSRPAQKELVRTTISNMVDGLMNKVGEDLREDVRTVVKEGYDNNLSTDEIGNNISSTVTSIKNKRARSIARTEIARTATISDYIINKERGATHFYVECRNTACPICKNAWHEEWSMENDEGFSPNDTSAGGKGWIGDKTYSMNDTSMLPPIHPNCRCVPYFVNEDEMPKGNRIVKNPVRPTATTKQKSSEYLPQEVEQKFNKFAKEYLPSRQEHMQFVTTTSASEVTHGQNTSVRRSSSQEKFMEEQTNIGNEIHGIHTHPNQHEVYTMLSHEDIIDAFLPWQQYNLKSFSAENKRNRVSIIRTDDNFLNIKKPSKVSNMITLDIHTEVNKAWSLYKDRMEAIRSAPDEEILWKRERRKELQNQGLSGYEMGEIVDKEAANKKFRTVEEIQDDEFPKVVEEMNAILNPFGVTLKVKYKDK